jgi:Ribonuclease G/E
MRRELVISAGPGEWRAALLEDGAAVELRVERGDGAEAGSIHLGRVARLLPALGAALVEIGGDRPAFLPQSETFPRGRRLDEGERVVVQIRREAQGGKAAQLTTALALRGRHVELIAGRSGIFGGKALSPQDRAQLVNAVADAPPPGPLRAPGEREGAADPRIKSGEEGERPGRKGAIGLRISEPAPIEAVVAEAAALRRRLDDVAAHAGQLGPPARLHPAATFAAALAGVMAPVERVLVDEPAAIPEIRAGFPAASVAHLPEPEWPVDLGALFDAALAPTVGLSGGGTIHFEPTRAAALVDVDSGTPEGGSPERTALAVDLAAAQAVARHIRLRNIAGGIVVDFVGLDDRALRERVRTALARALAADPLQPQILGWTRLGHLELVRRRRTRPLAESLLEAAPAGGFVKTAVTVAHEALRALRREARAAPASSWRLTVAPEVAAALADQAARAVRALEERLGRSIAVTADPGLARDRVQITPV